MNRRHLLGFFGAAIAAFSIWPSRQAVTVKLPRLFDTTLEGRPFSLEGFSPEEVADLWKPTPDDRRLVARVVRDGNEVLIEYRDLKPGDVYQTVGPDGKARHPFTLEIDNETFAVCTGEPERNLWTNEGYAVPSEAGARTWPKTEKTVA
jgi:hypothetical protein